MGYRIHLHIDEKSIEIWDSTPINNFKVTLDSKDNEYPDYIVDRQAMLEIIEFYQTELKIVAEEKKESAEDRTHTAEFWYGVAEFFNKVNTNKMIINSDIFVIQYFYLVDLYNKTDRENNPLKITHG